MIHTRWTTPPGRRRRVLATVAATTLAVASIGITTPGVTAQGSLSVAVGVGQGTEAGNAFLPGDVTIGVGDSITFVIESDEPHTITTGEGPPGVPPFAWPLAGFDEAGLAGPPPWDLGSASTDGSAFVHTGILAVPGSSAAIEFTAPGAYPIICSIHPGMSMEVTVVEEGPVTTQEEADAAADASRQVLTEAFAPTREARLASTSAAENEDGSTTWGIFADASTPPGPMPGGGTGYVELLEFLPGEIEIGAGDTVRWAANQAHTVTFLPEGVELRDVYPSPEAAVAPAGGTSFDGSEITSSGFLGVPGPDGSVASEYALTFPEPGTYAYVCAIHLELGQLGTVIVT